MGVTSYEIELLKSIVIVFHPTSVLELGSQNLYLKGGEPPFASEWYLENGFTEYVCIDLGGDNGAIKEDLAYPIHPYRKFDLVTDFGTSEHVVQMKGRVTVGYNEGRINSIYPNEILSIENGYFECWRNKHNFLKVGGIMISVNPKTGHWKGHGYSYITTDFYRELAELTDYRIIELCEHPAMGNEVDGMNVVCVMKKNSDKFPTKEEFFQLPIFKS